jgi:para-aminobenzoate synthetase/4-amino-4-deoxychorismate lyase
LNIHRALLYDNAQERWLAYEDPVDVLMTTDPAKVLEVMSQIERRVEAQGLIAVGFVTYEAAAGFDSALTTHGAAELPLVCFALFRSFDVVAAPSVGSAVSGQLWRCSESAENYRQAIAHIRELIGAGSVYQINHTTRLQGTVSDGAKLFAAVAGGAPHGAYLEGDTHSIVSASPECFFSLDGDRVYSQPMKGTAAREGDPEQDRARGDWLKHSTKNRAENLMITDMVRNDLGRVAEPGSVEVSDLFALEQYPTVWQMTSRVQARTSASVTQLFQQLFPAASITGAPKKAAMEHIRQLESTPREIYTGAIGTIAPNRQAHFNIAIRTAWINHQTGVARYGAGGGVVWDSNPNEEYQELLSKTQILHQVIPAEDFELFETLGWSEQEGAMHLERHLARMLNSARHFGFAVGSAQQFAKAADEAVQLAIDARSKSDRPQGQSTDRYRLRLTLGSALRVRAELMPAPATTSAAQPVALSNQLVDSADPALGHKTTLRHMYQRARAQVAADYGDHVEPLLVNERNEITESDIANVVFELEGKRYTPPIHCGLLPGVMRGMLLDTGALEERVLSVGDLGQVDALYLINDLRGWRRAELVSRTLGP